MNLTHRRQFRKGKIPIEGRASTSKPQLDEIRGSHLAEEDLIIPADTFKVHDQAIKERRIVSTPYPAQHRPGLSQAE